MAAPRADRHIGRTDGQSCSVEKEIGGSRSREPSYFLLKSHALSGKNSLSMGLGWELVKKVLKRNLIENLNYLT